MKKELDSTVLGHIFKTEFFKRQRLLDDFHLKLENPEYWLWLSHIYLEWLNQKTYIKVVPKKIHQIWLGSSLPKKYVEFQKSWQNLNPDYEYRLWTDKDITELNLINSEQYLASDNFGVKSDLARYEILYRFGGIYVDTDFECLKPINDQFLSRSFLAGQVFSYAPQLNNAIIFAAPKDKFLKLIIENIPSHPDRKLSAIETLDYCGATFLSRLLWKYRQMLSSGTVILPSQYFYSWPNYRRADTQQKYNFITNDSVAIHHWEVSWAKKSLKNRVMNKLANLIGKRIK